MQQLKKPKQGYKLVKSLFGKYEEIPEDWELVRKFMPNYEENRKWLEVNSARIVE